MLPRPATMKRGAPTSDPAQARGRLRVTRRWIAAALLAAVLVVAGWFGWQAWTRDRSGPASSVSTASSVNADDSPTETVETVDTGAAPVPTGGTPMAQRIAVIGLLNKRNGESRELTLRPGQAVQGKEIAGGGGRRVRHRRSADHPRQRAGQQRHIIRATDLHRAQGGEVACLELAIEQ